MIVDCTCCFSVSILEYDMVEMRLDVLNENAVEGRVDSTGRFMSFPQIPCYIHPGGEAFELSLS